MRFSTSFLLFASMFAFASNAFALSIKLPDSALPSIDAAAPNSKREVVTFTHVNNELMAPHDVELVRRVGWTYRNNQALLLAVIAKNAYMINATCSTGNIITCGIGVTYSVFTFFFAAWLWADRRADGLAGANPTFVFGPTPSKTLRQRLTTELPAGQWHYLGHVHHGGVNHTVHYYGHGGGVHQLRAETMPFWDADAPLSARQEDESNDGGFVGGYYWNSNNEGPYDSFHSTSDGTSFFAANAAGYMIDSQQGILACAGFQDADGFLDNGILTYGWNGQDYQWLDGQMDATFGLCSSELGDGPQ